MASELDDDEERVALRLGGDAEKVDDVLVAADPLHELHLENEVLHVGVRVTLLDREKGVLKDANEILSPSLSIPVLQKSAIFNNSQK